MDDLEKAKRLKHGKHNQLVHGNRYGQRANLTLERARALRKTGDFKKYVAESRRRSGTKPARERPKVDKKKQEVLKRPDYGKWDKPASDKQKSYLGDLLNKAKSKQSRYGELNKVASGILDRITMPRNVTKNEASRIIDFLKNKDQESLTRGVMTIVRDRLQGKTGSYSYTPALLAFEDAVSYIYDIAPK